MFERQLVVTKRIVQELAYFPDPEDIKLPHWGKLVDSRLQDAARLGSDPRFTWMYGAGDDDYITVEKVGQTSAVYFDIRSSKKITPDINLVVLVRGDEVTGFTRHINDDGTEDLSSGTGDHSVNGLFARLKWSRPYGSGKNRRPWEGKPTNVPAVLRAAGELEE